MHDGGLGLARRTRIDALASELVRRTDAARSLPVDVEAVARALGVDVVHVDGIVGGVIPNTTGQPLSGLMDFVRGRVYVNSRETPERQRFTLAHELGHEALGHEQMLGEPLHAVGPEDATPGPAGLLEREADHFAARLLVPPAVLDREIARIGCASVPILARRFCVSAHAMQLNLRSYLPPGILR